jgi:hypothetical protein
MTKSELRILHHLLDLEENETPRANEKGEKVMFDLMRQGMIEIKLTDLGRQQVKDRPGEDP